MKQIPHRIQNFFLPDQNIALTDMYIGWFALLIGYVVACIPVVIILFLIEVF